MSRPLQRLLRIRILQEEVLRKRFEREAAELSELRRRSSAAGKAARQSRESVFQRTSEVLAAEADQRATFDPTDHWPGRDDRRLTEERSWDLSMRWQALIEARRPGQQAGVERSQAEFLAGRLNRRQVEALVEAEAVRERVEHGRREQAQLDIWFQARRIRAGECGKKS